MTTPNPRIDLTSIPFPTDNVRIRDLIDRYPECFSWDSDQTRGLYRNMNAASSVLMDAMEVERNLAQQAFVKTLGVSQIPNPIDRAAALQDLAEAYESLGLARGIGESTELARRFENAAGEQARGLGL
ncbi:MAG: hypothetical protein AAGG48_22865 [Planctomycetota bacterium]